MQNQQDKSSNEQPQVPRQQQGDGYQKLDIQLPVKGMVMDFSPLFQPDGTYTFALNATKISMNGIMNSLSNEESNKEVAEYPPTALIKPDIFVGYEELEFELPTSILVTNHLGVWNEEVGVHQSGVERTYYIYYSLNEETQSYVYTHIEYIEGNFKIVSKEMFNWLFNDNDIVNIYLEDFTEENAYDFSFRYEVPVQITKNRIAKIEKKLVIGTQDKMFNEVQYNKGTFNLEFGENSSSQKIIEQIRDNTFGIKVNNQVLSTNLVSLVRKEKEHSRKLIVEKT